MGGMECRTSDKTHQALAQKKLHYTQDLSSTLFRDLLCH